MFTALAFAACFSAGNGNDSNGGSSGGTGGQSSSSGSTGSGTGGSAQGGEGGDNGGTGTGGTSAGGTNTGGTNDPGSGGNGGGGTSGGSAGSNPSGGSNANGGEGGTGDTLGALLFSEDFEDGDYDGWAIAGQSHEATVVSNTGAQGTTHSLLLTSLASPADYLGLYRTFTDIKPTYVSYWVLCGTYEGTRVALSGTHPNTNPFSIVFWGSLDTVYAANGNQLVQGLGTWHQIEIRIDWDAGTVDYYGDGILRDDGVPFYYGTSTSLGRMDFSHFGDGSCHLDQIEFRE